MRSTKLALALGLVSVLACSSSSAPAPPAAPTVAFTMSATVKAGTEQFLCQFVTMPAAEGYVTGMSHTYTPGSHHMLLFRTDLTTLPAGSDQPVDCYEGTGDVMSHARGVVYGSQTPQGGYTMPAGVGLHYDAGEVILFQSHYLNAGSADIDAKVDVELTLGDASIITQQAGVLFFYDPFIDVPAGGTGSASMRCLIPNDVTLLTATSHFHARGRAYSAFLDPPGAPPATTPFYTASDWNWPPDLAHTVPIAAGTHLRFGCNYDNTQGTQPFFQGQSAQTNEMCVFSGIYYPAMSLADEMCLTSADMFGTGTAGCGDTLSCVQACPAGSAPVGLLSSNPDPNVDPCWQSCIAKSCPGASGPFFDQMECIESSCLSECASGGSSCVSCALSKCQTTTTACLSASCGAN